MPSRNVIKSYVPESFYHLFNKGVDGRKIFLDEADYSVFLNLLERYLSPVAQRDAYGRVVPSLYEDVELQAYCLLADQFHLLVYTQEGHKITELMRRVCTAYTAYFNKRYKRAGHLFQGTFRATKVESGEDVVILSRYIHRLPQNYHAWPYSSLQFFIGTASNNWVRPGRLYDMYDWGAYRYILEDDADYKLKTERIKTIAANY